MCGRYYLHITMERLLERYGIKEAGIDFESRREIFPSELAPVVLSGNKNFDIKLFKWGFLPSYRKGLIINTRSETIDQKPMFKESFAKRRCIIPASGFFEWKGKKGQKRKYKIYLHNEQIISLAGIYDTFSNKNGQDISCFSIITTDASSEVSSIHNRMPVILPKDRENFWLDRDNKDTKGLKEILKPRSGCTVQEDDNSPQQLGFDF